MHLFSVNFLSEEGTGVNECPPSMATVNGYGFVIKDTDLENI